LSHHHEFPGPRRASFEGSAGTREGGSQGAASGRRGGREATPGRSGIRVSRTWSRLLGLVPVRREAWRGPDAGTRGDADGLVAVIRRLAGSSVSRTSTRQCAAFRRGNATDTLGA